jgi:hypothetical protein
MHYFFHYFLDIIIRARAWLGDLGKELNLDQFGR